MSYSVQYTTSIATLVGAFLALIGVNIDQAQLASWVGTTIVIVSGIIALIDRFKKNDITLLGRRK